MAINIDAQGDSFAAPTAAGVALGLRMQEELTRRREQEAMEQYRQANLEQEQQKMLQDAQQFMTLKRIQEMMLNEQQQQTAMDREVTAAKLKESALNIEMTTRRPVTADLLKAYGSTPGLRDRIVGHADTFGGVSASELRDIEQQYRMEQEWKERRDRTLKWEADLLRDQKLAALESSAGQAAGMVATAVEGMAGAGGIPQGGGIGALGQQILYPFFAVRGQGFQAHANKNVRTNAPDVAAKTTEFNTAIADLGRFDDPTTEEFEGGPIAYIVRHLPEYTRLGVTINDKDTPQMAQAIRYLHEQLPAELGARGATNIAASSISELINATRGEYMGLKNASNIYNQTLGDRARSAADQVLYKEFMSFDSKDMSPEEIAQQIEEREAAYNQYMTSRQR